MALQNAIQDGVVLDAKYRLERELGAGGMGAVWIAEDLQLARRVAIKFPAAEYLRDEAALARFRREARLAGRLRSPHVVQVFGQGSTPEGIPYIAMELLEGCDLAEHIARRGRCSLAETGEILEQLCRALSRAHQTGLIHRDIKPQNIFVSPESDGRLFVKVLDFGIAKDIETRSSALTRPNVSMGSLCYMSPEQIRDTRSVGPQTDIWSLGVVIYEMLTGGVPFDGSSGESVMYQMTVGEFAPVSQRHDDLPRSVDALLSRALQVDPALRFATVDELNSAFARIVRGNASGIVTKEPPLSNQSGAAQTQPGPKPNAKTVPWSLLKLRGMAPTALLCLSVAFGIWQISTRPEATTVVVKPRDDNEQLPPRLPSVEPDDEKPHLIVPEPSPQAPVTSVVDAGVISPTVIVDKDKDEPVGPTHGTDAQREPSGTHSVARKSGGPKLTAASDALRAAIVAAVARADALEARALRTLSAAGLSSAYSGLALQAMLTGIKTLTARQEFQASELTGSQFESVLVSKDEATAQVRTTETWETSWYDRNTNVCKRHIHKRAIPQTIFMRFRNGAWLIEDVKHHVGPPALSACHAS